MSNPETSHKIEIFCVFCIIQSKPNPGGVDFNAAKNLGKNVIWALSLPGKYAPATSGKTLAKMIKIIMDDIKTDAILDSERCV